MSKVIALDVDDTLMGCIDLATNILHLDFSIIDDWNLRNVSGLSADQTRDMLALWRTDLFVKCQTPYAGAQDFIQALIDDGYRVLIASAVPPEVMTARAQAIRKFFPMIPERDIMLGGSKQLLAVDVLVDDNPANLGHGAKNSILFAQPHNVKSTVPFPRTSDYDEILRLIRAYTK